MTSLQIKREFDCAIYRFHFSVVQHTDAFFEQIFSYCHNCIQIYDAQLWKPIPLPQMDLHRDIPDISRDLRNGNGAPYFICLIPRKKHDRPSSQWFWQLCPPDLAPSHYHSSLLKVSNDAFSQPAICFGSSGFFEYPRSYLSMSPFRS